MSKMQANTMMNIDKRIIRLASGLIIGLICGLIAMLLAFPILIGLSEFTTTRKEDMSVVFDRVLFFTLFYSYFWHLAAIEIGIVVGTVNAITKGGIGIVGIEWGVIVGVAFAIGAKLWQIEPNHLYLGVVSGIIAGLVGFFTWYIFRDKGVRNKITKLAVIGYSLAFIVIAILGPVSYIDFLAGFD